MLSSVTEKLKERGLNVEEDVEIIGLSGIKHKINFLIKCGDGKIGVFVIGSLNYNKLSKVLATRLDTELPLIILCNKVEVESDVINSLRRQKVDIVLSIDELVSKAKELTGKK